METKDYETAATAMLERARDVLALTHTDWRLHEAPVRRRKPVRRDGKRDGYGYDQGFAATRKPEANVPTAQPRQAHH